MAKKVITTLIDDLDGSPAQETLQFAIDGAQYEIDLNEDNIRRLREALQPFVQAARKNPSRRRPRATASGPSTAEVRAWAQKQGILASSRGRVQAEIVNQYLAAN